MSLLEPASMFAGEARFRMLETIRAYARAQLEVTGERAAVEARHDADVLARGEALLERGALAALEPDLASVQAALDRAAERGNGEAAVRLAALLAAFWRTRGPWGADLPWRPPAIARRGPIGPDVRGRAALQTLLGVEAWLEGDRQTAEHALARSLADAERTGDRLGIADAALGLARLAGDAGERSSTRRLLDLAGAHYRQLGDRSGEALVLGRLAELAPASGDAAPGPGEGPRAPDEEHAEQSADRTAASPALVDRELTVLALAASGLPTKQIARRLHLGERTIKIAVADACRKLGARNRVHALVLAAQRGLLAGPASTPAAAPAR